MRISPNAETVLSGNPIRKPNGYTLWLSANDTYRWATRPGNHWPCSDLSGKRIRIEIDGNGLCGLAIDGRDQDCRSPELDAIVDDHLPAHLRHLWPTWECAAVVA